MDKIATYIEKNPRWSSALKTLRSLLLEHPFQETLKWKAPVYTAYGRNLVGIAAFKNHFSLWFYEGYLLEDAFGHLENVQEGKTKYLRQWKFSGIDEIDKEHVRAYLKQTLELAAVHEAPKPSVANKAATNTKPHSLLHEALANDTALKQVYEAFPPFKKREFSEHIAEAKRESTQQRRLQKVLENLFVRVWA
ncbi:DUF1801 domain-containing protein [Robertkochia sediminum]|uniref:DUF1801 domain-containing protein n=1 Tax=Robertkochia sediminum TaxID=2785326 RepID=UPI00193438FD|nr:DUF1801 domain-containing protein [Robertkochia sediminum]MBL7472546.1 YdeI/OmpD-associated family protein [Robertkochia sediminum]